MSDKHHFGWSDKEIVDMSIAIADVQTLQMFHHIKMFDFTVCAALLI